MASQSTTPSKDAVSEDVINFIRIFPSLQITDDAYSNSKKVKCNLTGHEMPCRLPEIETYTKGKRFKIAQERDKDKFEKYKPHIVPSTKKGREDQLFCTLTIRHINRVPAHVERHVNGRRYKKALAKYEECQRLGIKFKPLTRSKKREEDPDSEEVKKYSHYADSETSESEAESDDSMSDLYPREHFERLGGEEMEGKDSDSDFDIENMDCGSHAINESNPSSSSQLKRKNKSKRGGRRKFSKTQAPQQSQNGAAGKKDVLYMMYNDEYPDGTKKEDKGHTKGSIAFDNESGFWLIHSIPKFPDFARNSYTWPDNGCAYGQSMLCISMQTDQFVEVGNQLLYNYPGVYDWNIPSSFQSKFSDFVDVSKGKSIQQPPWNNTVLLTSLAGQSFTSFAKFTKFNHDLYWYLVAPTLGDDLYVETWMHTSSKLPSSCNGSYHVENVQYVGFPAVPEYKETADHSKWAIGMNKKWVCIGDINRTGSQFKRGGGTVCALLPEPWGQYSSAIQVVDKCPTNRGNRIRI